MTINKSSSKNYLANAYTNNTFSLDQTEKTLISSVENSFNYLSDLQLASENIYKYDLTEDNIYVNDDGSLSLSIDKDFIEASKRKKYKDSMLYNKYITLDDINNNPDIFSYIPIILVDSLSIFAFRIKLTINGRTEILFDNTADVKNVIRNLKKIQVIFFKNAYLHKFNINRYTILNNKWVIPKKTSNILLHYNTSFLLLKSSQNILGTNFCPISVGDSGEIIIDYKNEYINSFIHNHFKAINIYFLSIPNLMEVSGFKTLSNRIDNNLSSAISVIQPNDNDNYNMAIPIENLLLFKVDNTGEYIYENNKEIILHYPNIYEIYGDDFEYKFKLYYFYNNNDNILKYRNHLKYIYRFLKQKLSTDTVEEAINKLLYSSYSNSKIQDYFFEIFNYNDPYYEYTNNDYFNTMHPYTFDYKVEKLKSFIEYDPFILRDYAKNVLTPFHTYYLYTRNIDLSYRIRRNTYKECVESLKRIEFTEDHYVFALKNETYGNLNLRIFIDGILCYDYKQIHSKNHEFIYIPTRSVTTDSYIEIANFDTYSFTKEIEFSSINEGVTIEFDKNLFMEPTLYDLYVTDENHNKISRSQFKIYGVINSDEYDVSDYITSDPNGNNSYVYPEEDSWYIDSETGELCIEIRQDFNTNIIPGETCISLNDDVIIDNSDNISRIPLKYMTLKKIKVFSIKKSTLNQKFNFTVSKIPYIRHFTVNSNEPIYVKLFNNIIDWREDNSYIRTFVNGRLYNINYNLCTEHDGSIYFSTDEKFKIGTVITVDITPYSYIEEFSMERVPSDYIIPFISNLSKPFDTSYYDIYLNGRKLSDNNIQVISPTKIKLLNVKSRYNLYIYKRDRDYEYYGFNKEVHTMLDTLIDSDIISHDDINMIIDDIVYDNHDKEFISKNTNTEDNIYKSSYLPTNIQFKIDFYEEKILPLGVSKPNTTYFDKNEIYEEYNSIYESYSNKKNRLIIKPNINYDSNMLLLVGKKCQEVICTSGENIIL